MKEIKVDENMIGRRLDRVIHKLNPTIPMTKIFKLLRKKSIRVNGRRAEANYLLQTDDCIQLPTLAVDKPMQVEYKRGYELSILYEDSNIIAIDKPAGLAAQGGKNIRYNAISELSAQLGRSIYPIHRLDQGTSGCMVFAKNAMTARLLSEQFHNRLVEKTYLACTEWLHTLSTPLVLDKNYFQIKGLVDPFNDMDAKTTIIHQEKLNDMQILTLKPFTGRKHQIRIHLAAIKHPILGDRRYGHKVNMAKRLMLHADSIRFNLENQTILIRSKQSSEFIASVKGLDKTK